MAGATCFHPLVAPPSVAGLFRRLAITTLPSKVGQVLNGDSRCRLRTRAPSKFSARVQVSFIQTPARTEYESLLQNRESFATTGPSRCAMTRTTVALSQGKGTTTTRQSQLRPERTRSGTTIRRVGENGAKRAGSMQIQATSTSQPLAQRPLVLCCQSWMQRALGRPEPA